MSRMVFDTQETSVVPPKQARAWMFDLTPDDHKHERFTALWKPKPGDGRRIVSKSAT